MAALLVVSSVIAGASYSCEVATIPQRDLRTKQNPDCSFVGAGQNDWISGYSARDIGNGKVAFRLADDSSCGPQEKLVFVDCDTAQSIAIRGAMDPKMAALLKPGVVELLGVDERIKFIQPPFGPIRVTEASTVASLAKTASRANYKSLTDLPEWISSFKRRDRFDLFCGCKVYYPDSEGAKQ